MNMQTGIGRAKGVALDATDKSKASGFQTFMATITPGMRDAREKLNALDAVMSTIEFRPDGTMVTANANFLDLMGYTLPEIVGRHHRIFVDPSEHDSPEYRDFWTALQRGEAKASVFRRINKDGKPAWIRGAYTPVRNAAGKVTKIFKVFTDITAAKAEADGFRREIEAISRSQAVIHFAPDGTIQSANQNFLSLMGYSMAEIAGKHHRIFVDPAYAGSRDYAEFWDHLKSGKDHVAEFLRLTKSGKRVWIQGSYSAVLDADGAVERVIKVASDITETNLIAADHAGQIEAIGRSQAVIKFEMDGTIIDANNAFLTTLGYQLNEIVGKHHRMFVAPEERKSAAYGQFWADLQKGQFQQAEFKRIGKSGKEVWIPATYNPILGDDGKPVKVVKFATDITAQVRRRLARQEAQNKIAHDLSSVSEAVGTAKTSSADAASASTQASQNLQAVASGAEEMNISIQEIASTMVRSRETADQAYAKISSANEASKQFLTAAQEMGQIVELIRGIAGQINLLSLNATIESARAGEAGRGFAVVASEVKSLARQAAEATDKVAAEIESVQAASAEVGDALAEIGSSLAAVREYVVGTSSAVEEQSAVAREISSNIQEASQGVEQVSGYMQRIVDETVRADAAVEAVAQESRRMIQ